MRSQNFRRAISEARDGVYARVDHGGTIVLVLGLAEVALQTRLDLSADADAVTLSDAADVLAHADCAADNLVADAEGALEIAPAARHGVHIGAAHAAGIDFDVDIVVLKGLGLELSLVELVPCLRPDDAETSEGIRVSHFDGKINQRDSLLDEPKQILVESDGETHSLRSH
jgi:hypothetical protein